MKKIINFTLILGILFFANTNYTYSQLKVLSNGSVEINSYALDYGRAVRTTVHNPNACAYHLTYNGVDKFYVSASGFLWCSQGGYFGSDLKLKQNINKINSPLSLVMKLNGIQFDYKEDKGVKKEKGQRLGFIAQDIEKILPGIVKTMPDSTKGIAYTDLTALLVEAIKEQQNQIDELKKLINISYSQKQIIEESNESNDLPNLKQNSPNPFNKITKIGYFLPETIKKASLFIYDMNGKQIKNMPIYERGNGYITINESDLQPGIYIYSLIVDDKEVDTKKMILTN
ncbi:MAG: T9SS type A sorting domain-containing protein [Bacteroidales bacterium]|nr:T9SS type A sorting domain-containing protein [Bacteroidales bacterium]